MKSDGKLSSDERRVLTLVHRHHPYTAPELAHIAGWKPLGSPGRMLGILESLRRKGRVIRGEERVCMRSNMSLPLWRAVEDKWQK